MTLASAAHAMLVPALRICAVLTVLLLPATSSAIGTADAPAAATVEAGYAERGPWAVTAVPGFGCCDSSGASYDLWRPADLGAGGVRHPIVTWGNGTNATPDQYAHLLEHLASWGFVVVAARNQQTGSGKDIAGAVEYLLRQAEDPASPLYGRVDPDAVGAVGHSQGATGVLNAMALSGGRIKTAVPLELPIQLWCSTGSWCPDIAGSGHGSIFLVNGSADGVISPSRQLLPPQVIGLQSIQAYYEAIPASVPKVWGTLAEVNHNDVQGKPQCSRTIPLCALGVHGYLGYPTAWLAARLLGDTAAQRAFVSGSGEFFTRNPNWSNQIGNITD
ncbi:poly(ethylene terephthalate) hydrolase family protein [Nocardia sp. NPDC003693]